MSNLFLANREARLCAPSGIDSEPQNQWAALRAALEMASKKPKSMVLVGIAGIGPFLLSTAIGLTGLVALLY